MTHSFNEQFDEHGAWRREFALRLKLLAEWMKDNELLDSSVEERLRRLGQQVRNDKVMVAFVAEFSRGKSEMINAVFFAGYGRRIMPAAAGRTTMCPTEMAYDAEVPACMRLLPIETRLQPQALMEWRAVPQKWTRIDLDVHDPQQLANAFEKVAETRKVTPDEARALGFWNANDEAPVVDAQGLVEVPRWRHALINIAHPLLKQGLVILDTPGLNAIGAEPELTVSLIPQAQAVVFILGADTGVTQSDLSIWREHLAGAGANRDTRLVVLNKIDTLWDALSTPEQTAKQIERQRAASAEILGVAPDQVLAISAQKGLVAKVTKDAALLQQSCLPQLEDALGQAILSRRQSILGSAVACGIRELRTDARRIITLRQRDLSDQLMELRGLQGKNATVVKHMHARIRQEKDEFDAGGARIQAVRSVHLRLLRELFGLLGSTALKKEMAQLSEALQQKGLKLGVKRAYGDTFVRLHANIQRAYSLGSEIQAMLDGSFRQLNAEYGFSLQVPALPEIDRYQVDLDAVERSHLQYLSMGNAFKLAQSAFSERLVRALATRLHVIFDCALAEIELWSKAAAAQLDAQLRERRRNFARRLEAIERMQQAAGGLDERIDDMGRQATALQQIDSKLEQVTDHLVAVQRDSAPSAPKELV